MRNTKYLIILVLISACMYTDVIAQRHVYRRGKMTRHYNPETVRTIQGVIENMERIKRSNWYANREGIHITVKTDQEKVTVHLGPAWFINGKIALEEGDTVEVEGSVITYALKEIMIARRIKKGDTELILRDNTGTPAWSGMGIQRQR